MKNNIINFYIDSYLAIVLKSKLGLNSSSHDKIKYLSKTFISTYILSLGIFFNAIKIFKFYFQFSGFSMSGRIWGVVYILLFSWPIYNFYKRNIALIKERALLFIELEELEKKNLKSKLMKIHILILVFGMVLAFYYKKS
jgi:hypothetical protein